MWISDKVMVFQNHILKNIRKKFIDGTNTVKHPVCTIVQQYYELLLFHMCVCAKRLARDDERAGAASDAVPRVRARGATNRTGSSSPARRRPCPKPDDDQRDTSTRPFWLWHTRHTHTDIHTHVTFDHDDFPARIKAVSASSANIHDDARVGSGTVSVVGSCAVT